MNLAPKTGGDMEKSLSEEQSALLAIKANELRERLAEAAAADGADEARVVAATERADAAEVACAASQAVVEKLLAENEGLAAQLRGLSAGAAHTVFLV